VDMLTNKELLKAYRIAVMEKLDADFIEMLFHEIVRRKLDKPLNSELDKEIDKSGT
jgi:DNA-binding phage protein